MSTEHVHDVLISLKVISFIKEGQKVCIRNGVLTLETQSTGIIASFRRWINYDSRVATITYIHSLIRKAMYITNNGNEKEREKMLEALKECIPGLDALMITYNDDAYTHSTLQVIKEQVVKDYVL
jgi:hypothetical protein